MKKIDRLERKQKKKERKLARALKRAGIAQDQIGAIKEDGVALSLSLTPEQIALLTSPRKHNAVGEPEYIKVCKKVNITWSPTLNNFVNTL